MKANLGLRDSGWVYAMKQSTEYKDVEDIERRLSNGCQFSESMWFLCCLTMDVIYNLIGVGSKWFGGYQTLRMLQQYYRPLPIGRLR